VSGAFVLMGARACPLMLKLSFGWKMNIRVSAGFGSAGAAHLGGVANALSLNPSHTRGRSDSSPAHSRNSSRMKASGPYLPVQGRARCGRPCAHTAGQRDVAMLRVRGSLLHGGGTPVMFCVTRAGWLSASTSSSK
jgi:hypothetical protein